MNPLQWFEPNVHPVIVHFAFALIVASALCFVLALRARNADRKRSLQSAADWMLGLGTVAVIAAVAAGFQAFYTVAHDGPSHAAMLMHRFWALGSLVLVLAIAAWRWQRRNHAASWRFGVASFLVAGAVTMTAWHGGALVFKHGLGVASLPAVSGEGHDHHGEDEEHAHDPADIAATISDASSDGESHAAHDHEAAGESDAPPRLSAIGEQAATVADAFSKALSDGDTAALQGLTSEALLVGEGGGLEHSFTEYASHHLPADIAFVKDVDATRMHRQVITGDHMATVITQSQLHGVFRGEPVHSRLLETLVLSLVDDTWRITHVHWSSAPIEGEHEH